MHEKVAEKRLSLSPWWRLCCRCCFVLEKSERVFLVEDTLWGIQQEVTHSRLTFTPIVTTASPLL